MSEKTDKRLSRLLKGKEIYKPMDTGWIDSRVACLREYAVNVFFYRKNGRTIMIDAGCDYEKLQKKMSWLGIRPEEVSHIFLTHQDADRVGALEKGREMLFPEARVYLGSLENEYFTGLFKRKIFNGMQTVPGMQLNCTPSLLKDRQVVKIRDIQVESILVPGHTLGHMVYLIDNTYLFTGDALWLGPDGGYSFLNILADNNKLASESLQNLKEILKEKEIQPVVITGHTGWTDDFYFAFAHIDKACNALKKQKPHDPAAPEDPYLELTDIEKKARTQRLEKQKKITP